MAKASTTTIEKKVTKTERVPAITLTLDMDEARALRTLLGRVKGSGKTRGALAYIDDELYMAGVGKVDAFSTGQTFSGTVTFSSNPYQSTITAPPNALRASDLFATSSKYPF